MQEKKIEEILQEKAEQIKVRNFDEVWQDIKGEIEKEQTPQIKEKKLGWKKWLSLSLASCFILVAIILTPYLLKEPKPVPEELFYADKLSRYERSADDMLSGLSQANILHVDFSDYEIIDCGIYLTEDNKVKGAEINLYEQTELLFFGLIKLYSNDVKLNIDIEKDYDTEYKTTNYNAHYKFNREENNMFYYDIYAVKNGVQYVIEYTGISDNVVEFLNVFFG